MICMICRHLIEGQLIFWEIPCLRAGRKYACDTCMANFEPIAEQHCQTCYKEGEEETCSDCLYWLEQGVKVDHLALYRYNDAMKDYFSLYKFHGDRAMSQVFGETFWDTLLPYRKEGYTVVPVPVSPETLAERGFNQVESLLNNAEVPFQKLLTKAEGVKQSSKTRQERLFSQPQYHLATKDPLPKKVMLVDDVYTTGATIAAITRLLRENGVEEVKSFSLAR